MNETLYNLSDLWESTDVVVAGMEILFLCKDFLQMIDD